MADRRINIPATVGVLILAAMLPSLASAAPGRANNRAIAKIPARGVAATCAPRWQILPTPNTGTGFFAGAAAVSPQSVWAVGSVGAGTTGRPLAARWDGRGWRVSAGLAAATPSFFLIYGSGAALVAVAAASRGDLWAVGSAATDAGTRPLIARWIAGRWRAVAGPNPGPNARLLAVAAISPRDVWAVGDVAGTRTLAEQWNGRTWRIVSMPHVSGHDVLLSGLAALSASDIWAVGTQGSQSDGSRRGLIEQWDGTRWRVAPGPQPGVVDDILSAVSADRPDDVWAVGSAEGNDYQNVPLAERWDGTRWRVMPRPHLAMDHESLDAVAARSARDVWAAGGASLTHWTGARWVTTTLRTSSYRPGGDVTTASIPEFTALAVGPHGRLWAAGLTILQTDEQNTPLLAQYVAAFCG